MNIDSFAKFAKVFSEGILLVSRAGKILAANPAAATLLNRGDGGLEGLLLEQIVSDSAEDVSRNLQNWARSGAFSKKRLTFVCDGHPPLECQCEGARMTGGQGQTQLLLRVTNATGQRGGFSLLSKKIDSLNGEIRARKAAAFELEMARRTLEERVEQRTASLGEMHARIEAIVDSAPDGILTIDGSGSIRSFNPASEHMFGYDRSEAVGMQFVVLMLPEPGEEGGSAFPSPSGWTTPELSKRREIVGIRKDGSRFPVDIVFSVAIVDGKPITTGILRDITDRVEAATNLEGANRELVATSRLAGMAEVATGVLHNVGNILCSVNVCADALYATVGRSRLSSLGKVAELLLAQGDNLGDFMTADERGKRLPNYIANLAKCQVDEQQAVLEELDSLRSHISSVNQVVASQQACSRHGGIQEALIPSEVMDSVLKMKASVLSSRDIRVERDYAELTATMLERGKVLQILLNLIENAIDATIETGIAGGNVLRVAVMQTGTLIRFSVTDTGVGISDDDLARIFNFGFTTKADGHGFGLHHSANTATELGGCLRVSSDGLGCGATFCLELPLDSSAVAARAGAA